MSVVVEIGALSLILGHVLRGATNIFFIFFEIYLNQNHSESGNQSMSQHGYHLNVGLIFTLCFNVPRLILITFAIEYQICDVIYDIPY